MTVLCVSGGPAVRPEPLLRRRRHRGRQDGVDVPQHVRRRLRHHHRRRLARRLFGRAVVVVGADGKVAYTELVPEIGRSPTTTRPGRAVAERRRSVAGEDAHRRERADAPASTLCAQLRPRRVRRRTHRRDERQVDRRSARPRPSTPGRPRGGARRAPGRGSPGSRAWSASPPARGPGGRPARGTRRDGGAAPAPPGAGSSTCTDHEGSGLWIDSPRNLWVSWG